MNPKTLIPSLTAASLAVFLFQGCDTLGGGGSADSVAVTPELAGEALVRYHGKSSDWDRAWMHSSPQMPDFEMAQTSSLQKRAALAKASFDPGAALEFDFSDTATGVLGVRARAEILGVVTEAEAELRWDEKAKDDIEDNENIIRFKVVTTHPDGKVETMEITDADGDGLVNPVEGQVNLALVLGSSTRGDTVEAFEAKVDPGADLDYDTEGDNRMVFGRFTQKVAGSVTATGEFRDGDGDGWATDPSRASSLVDVTLMSTHSEDNPEAVKVEADITMRQFADGKEEPVRFAYKEHLKNGRVNQATIRNQDGGDVILKGEPLTVTLATIETAADDSLVEASAAFVINPGQDLESDADDLFLSLSYSETRRKGDVREAAFTFTPAEPVPQGQEPVAGTFSMEATYVGGQTAKLVGEFKEGFFTATYTGPDGATATVTYDATGAVVVGGV